MLKRSSARTFLLLSVVPTRSQLPNPGHPSRLFTIALPFVDVLLHLEVQVGTSQVGPGSEEFEDILLLHLQDIEASGHCGVSLWKQRQGTCGHRDAAQPGGDAPRGPAAPTAILGRLPRYRPQASAFPAARPGPPCRRRCSGMHSAPRCYRRAGNASPPPPARRPRLTLTTPCGGPGGAEPKESPPPPDGHI